MSTNRAREEQVLSQVDDPFVRRSLKTAMHVRRYMPFYVFGTIWFLSLALFPTVQRAVTGDNGSELRAANREFVDTGDGFEGTDSTEPVEVAADGTPAAASSSGTAAAAPTRRRTSSGSISGSTGSSGGAGTIAVDPALKDKVAATRGTGTTKAGHACGEGVRQVPQSSYAIPCQAAWTEGNPGATFRGVSDKTIKLVHRVFPESPNQQAVDRVNEQAGFASRDTVEAVRRVWVDYFNKTYELYGRQIEYQKWTSTHGGQTQSTDEAQGKGRENACADATQIVQELKAFAVLSSSIPFADCAAERELIVFNGAPYYPEKFFRERHPFVWHTLMECERISYQVGEYVGKRLLNRKAIFANDPVLQQSDRKFATYVPDNDGYQHCVNISREEIKRYGGDPGVRYDYQLDISRFPDQAAQASVQFKAAGATTVVLACDYISVIVLTSAATQQEYYPEWYIIGVAAQDTDNAARLYDQENVKGSLFGMSQLGPTEKVIGPESEPGRVYQQATGQQIPDGTTGDYFYFTHLYNMLQAAGPHLTPQTIAEGVRTIPPGGAPEYPYGYWSLSDGPDGTPGAGDHTEVDDSREVYWDADANGPDGKKGTYKETLGGKRFRNGEWPAEQPPVPN